MSGPRIAVDARPLCHPRTGIGRYTRELLKRLPEHGGEWFLYCPGQYDRTGLGHPAITHRSGTSGSGLACQWLYPRWCRADRVNAFWGPRHHLPLLHPRGLHTVLSIHDLAWRESPESMRPSRRLSEALQMPRAARRANVVVTDTGFVAAQLQDLWPALEGKIEVLPLGPGFDRDFGDPQGGDYFLFVGTMEPRKNLARLLRAFALYCERESKPLPLVVVGGAGWGGVEPTRLAGEFAPGAPVRIAGEVDDEQLRVLYAGARALVMPSLYEGFGLPVVEAFSQGVPAIVSRDSALSEVAGPAGFEVDPLDEEGICGALQTLAAASGPRAQLALAARERLARYDWDKAAAQLAGLLLGAP